MAELSEEHARMLIYSWARVANYHRSKPTVPNRVTTSCRGPLSLNAPHNTHPQASPHRPLPQPRPIPSRLQKPRLSSRLTAPPSRYMSSRSTARQKLLSGLPPATERPLDLVQQHIDQGEVTCAELSNTMQTWPQVVDADLKARKKAAMVDSVFSLPGIQLPHRETIHLPSILPHPSSHPPLSISITYTRTTPSRDMATTILPMTTPTDINNTPPHAPENTYTPRPLMETSTAAHRTTRQRERESSRTLLAASGHGGLAPAAVQAVNTHKLHPIRSSTYLQGEAIITRHNA